MDLYVQELGVAKTHDEFYTNMKIRQEFYKYLQFVVSRYANEPGIIAWELANDARCASTVPSSDLCNTNTVTLWHAETAKFVRSIDPNHLITSGYAYSCRSLVAFLIPIHIRAHGFFCPSCPKLFSPPHPPPPKPSPAPGSTRKRTAGGLMSPSRLLRMISSERRIVPRASGSRGGLSIRGIWTAPCMYPPLFPAFAAEPAFSRGEEADQRHWSCIQWSLWCGQSRYTECSRYRLRYIPVAPRPEQLWDNWDRRSISKRRLQWYGKPDYYLDPRTSPLCSHVSIPLS